MALFKNVNGTRIPLSSQEEASFLAEEAAWVAAEDDRKAEGVCAERNGLLLEVDAYVSNPLRWSELDATTQALWATYRLALLDVPQQTGFPQTVVWPTKVGE